MAATVATTIIIGETVAAGLGGFVVWSLELRVFELGQSKHLHLAGAAKQCADVLDDCLLFDCILGVSARAYCGPMVTTSECGTRTLMPCDHFTVVTSVSVCFDYNLHIVSNDLHACLLFKTQAQQ